MKVIILKPIHLSQKSAIDAGGGGCRKNGETNWQARSASHAIKVTRA
jgi:hypothetical protein